MKVTLRVFLLLLACGSILGLGAARGSAQGAGVSGSAAPALATSDAMMLSSQPASPVAAVRRQRSWELGPFVNYGFGLGNRDQYKFLSAGLEVGKVLTPVIHAGFASGQFQFAGNIMPLWQAYTPAPHLQAYNCLDGSGNPITCILPTGGGTFYGVSLTPVILRWNLMTHSGRWQAWVQGAGGVIYTTHKFPPNILSNPALGINGGTSVWNFSPQGGGGVHYFLRDKRSIDVGINGVHISSASLGDRNPGVNALVQVQVGYTFWK